VLELIICLLSLPGHEPSKQKSLLLVGLVIIVLCDPSDVPSDEAIMEVFPDYQPCDRLGAGVALSLRPSDKPSVWTRRTHLHLAGSTR
jgi:hypothetical protein